VARTNHFKNWQAAGKCGILQALEGGRTGFDLKDALEAACRGWFVGLVKNRTKNKC
jgi:beta-lactamase class D